MMMIVVMMMLLLTQPTIHYTQYHFIIIIIKMIYLIININILLPVELMATPSAMSCTIDGCKSSAEGAVEKEMPPIHASTTVMRF